jgi:hypothetical protein
MIKSPEHHPRLAITARIMPATKHLPERVLIKTSRHRRSYAYTYYDYTPKGMLVSCVMQFIKDVRAADAALPNSISYAAYDIGTIDDYVHGILPGGSHVFCATH